MWFWEFPVDIWEVEIPHDVHIWGSIFRVEAVQFLLYLIQNFFEGISRGIRWAIDNGDKCIHAIDVAGQHIAVFVTMTEAVGK
jgi:hypothetical protein